MSKRNTLNRRNFLKVLLTSTAAGLAAHLSGCAAPEKAADPTATTVPATPAAADIAILETPAPDPTKTATLMPSPTTAPVSTPATSNPFPMRALGKTGEQVTILGLGGLFTTSMDERHEQAVEIINRAIDLGINYIDTSAMYGNGGSERNIGAVMKDRRDEVFLASKSHDYTYDGTMALFEQSLERLQTDHLDLYQHHMLGGLGQLSQLRQENSARRAFEELRNQGVVKYLGVTSHSSRVLADALEDYPYDCALITLNAANEVMDDPDDLERFFQIAQDNEVGVIAMKVVARGALISERGLDIHDLLPYALSYPVSTAIIGISELAHLEENVEVAKSFQQLSREEMDEIRKSARA